MIRKSTKLIVALIVLTAYLLLKKITKSYWPIEYITKQLQKINLKVKIELSTQKVDFLDKTENLKKNKYKPFREENAKNIYKLHFYSSISNKKIPSMIIKRLPSLSKNQIYIW